MEKFNPLDSCNWFKPLIIDTQLLGRKTAKLLIEDKRMIACLPSCIDYLEQQGFELLYWRIADSNRIANSMAQILHGQKYGQQITMVCSHLAEVVSPLSRSSAAKSQIDIHQFTADKEVTSEFYQLTDRLLEYSHLALDEQLPKIGVRDIYRHWLINSINGSAAQMVLVAEKLGRLVGFVTLSYPQEQSSSHKRRGEIGLLAVAQNMQGQHIGSALLDQAILTLIRHQCHEIELTTQTSNNRAVSLYLSRQFKIAAHHNYYHFHLPTQ